jgi:hypothetical protein
VPREQLVHEALEVGREVLDDHEGEPAGRRDRLEEALESLQPAGRGTDADDEQGRRAGVDGLGDRHARIDRQGSMRSAKFR